MVRTYNFLYPDTSGLTENKSFELFQSHIIKRRRLRSQMYAYIYVFVLLTNTNVSSNPTHGEVYAIQHNVIKFVSDLRQIGCFSSSIPCSNIDRHDIIAILLKVALNTITPNPF